MTSTIKVDTISENTSANGVTIDGLTIKDGNIIGDVALAGTTPTFTIGDAGAEDAALIFDGNAQDFYIALDDSADDLIIGLGAAVGTTPMLSFTEAKAAAFTGAVSMATTLTLTGNADFNGDLDVDGTTNLDIVDIDGAVNMATTALVTGVLTTTAATVFNGGFASNANATITNANTSDTLSLINTSDAATVGPRLKFGRNSGSPADGDVTGDIRFEAKDDGGSDFTQVTIVTTLEDATNGTEDAQLAFDVMLAGTLRERMSFGSAATVFNDDSVDVDFRVESNGDTHALFVDGGNDRVGIGTASPDYTLTVRSMGSPSTDTIINIVGEAADANCGIQFTNSAGSLRGRVVYDTDDNNLQFNVNAAERMRIASDGDLHFAHTGFSATTPHLTFFKEGQIYFVMNSSSSTNVIRFYNSATGNVGGNINMVNDSTSYNSGSDYRLKDNVNYSFDATTRLKQLKPARFNFINTPDTTVDGFLAHEAQTVVPESVTGVHNETETRNKVVVNSNGIIIADDIEEADWTAGKIADDDGNTIYPSDSTWEASKVVPVYQSIDHSKMVPLLVKTIQELEARITTLEG